MIVQEVSWLSRVLCSVKTEKFHDPYNIFEL